VTDQRAGPAQTPPNKSSADSGPVSRDWSPLEVLIPADLLRAEAHHWAARIGVQLREIHIRPMHRKWASCSSRGRLTFSQDLLRQPATFRAQVIVHELVHLKVPNHGRLFRSLVRAYLANYRSSRAPDVKAGTTGCLDGHADDR
jgi:hypothetical protein